MFSQETINNCL